MSEPNAKMFNVQIDGVWHQFPKGTRLIEACEQAGSYVPRYCYHKKLSSPFAFVKPSCVPAFLSYV